MSESPDEIQPDSSAGGGGGSPWTSLPAILTALAVLISALVGAVTTLRGGDDENAQPATSAATEETRPPEDASLFAAVTRPTGRVYFDGETMYVKSSAPSRPFLVIAEGEEALEDVGMSVRVEWVSGARDYGVGLVCRYENAKNYYLLSVLSGGRYNIVRYRRGTPTSLTRGIQTSGSGDQPVNQIAAKCVGRDPASLTLTLNGRELASVRDASGISRGSVGLRLGTSESVVTCKFEDFALRFL